MFNRIREWVNKAGTDDISITPPNDPRPAVAIYARVSTKDRQDLETQLLPLREYVERRGWQISAEYVDHISGSVERRPGLDSLMEAAHRVEFKAVLVVRLDRFARSTKHLLTALETFNSLGIDFISLNESIDTSTPMGKMVFTVLGAVAELERAIIRERVKAGVAKARHHGKQLGRPRAIVDREAVRRHYAQNKSLRLTAQKFGIARDTVSNIVKASRNGQ